MTTFSIKYLESVDSTNAALLEMPEKDRAGVVLCAHEQRAGRGMGSNSWESSPGLNLTFSMGVDMSFLKAANQFLLSQAVPLGLLDVLDNCLSVEALVKWPNDIVVKGRKLAGILINSTIHGMMMGVSVIGIGLNVNQMQFQDWPTHPISMKMVFGKDVALEPLLKDLVAAVDRRIDLLHSSEGIAKIKDDYYRRMFRYHQWGSFETQKGVATLFVDGIDEFGRLITLNESEDIQVFDIKELKFL